MNRETLDCIVQEGLAAYAKSLLEEIGRFAAMEESDHRYAQYLKWTAEQIQKREHAISLIRDDDARLKMVDVLLAEMKR